MHLLNYEDTCGCPCSDPATLKSMLQFAIEARQLTVGRSRSDLDSDRQWNLAVVRVLELIGRAAAATSPYLQQQYSDIEWTRIQRWARDFLEHYDAVDLDTLWDDLQTLLTELEVELSCIIGDGLRHGITELLIRSHPHPSGPACVYAWEWFLENGDEGLVHLPIGLRWLVAVQDIDGHVGNGGFRGYLGDRTSHTGVLNESVQRSLDALSKMELTDTLNIATSAVHEWIVRLRVVRAAMDRGERPAFDAYEALARPLDQRWYDQDASMYGKIDAYIKSHPDQFIHP